MTDSRCLLYILCHFPSVNTLHSQTSAGACVWYRSVCMCRCFYGCWMDASFQLQSLSNHQPTLSPSHTHTHIHSERNIHCQQAHTRRGKHKKLAQPVQQVTSLHVIKPYGNVIIPKKYAVRRRTFIILTVLFCESRAHEL